MPHTAAHVIILLRKAVRAAEAELAKVSELLDELETKEGEAEDSP